MTTEAKTKQMRESRTVTVSLNKRDTESSKSAPVSLYSLPGVPLGSDATLTDTNSNGRTLWRVWRPDEGQDH